MGVVSADLLREGSSKQQQLHNADCRCVYGTLILHHRCVGVKEQEVSSLDEFLSLAHTLSLIASNLQLAKNR